MGLALAADGVDTCSHVRSRKATQGIETEAGVLCDHGTFHLCKDEKVCV